MHFKFRLDKSPIFIQLMKGLRRKKDAMKYYYRYHKNLQNKNTFVTETKQCLLKSY